MKKTITLGVALCAMTCPVGAQQAKTYSDGNRGEVLLPQGDLSFADAVADFTLGKGKPKATAIEASAALGPPDYRGNNNDGSFTTLGCGGRLELAFTDNALIDLDGPDLYVFEVGPDVEGTSLAISVDGTQWIEVGLIEGGRSEVDINGFALPGASYRYVRLTDDGIKCSGGFPGADIDAVAAIGSATRFVLDGGVLFAVDSAELLPEAQEALSELAVEIAASGLKYIQIIGHTDADGDDAYNLMLSQARSTAVADFLKSRPDLEGVSATAKGAGETEPVASNQTEAGRQANRRVEIIATATGDTDPK